MLETNPVNIVISNKKVNQSTGVSIVTCSNRLSSINNILDNYDRQIWPVKELIIIINNNQIDIMEWKKKAKAVRNVSIYRIDEKKNLGKCLNYAVTKSKYNYIAKFDDDDYYGKKYLRGLMQIFNYYDADVVGKKSFYIYFEKSNLLTLKFHEVNNRRVTHLAGSTLIINKKVFNEIWFSENIIVGTDSDFCRKCLLKDYKLYSGNRFNYVCVRKANSNEHTWKIKDEELMIQSILINETNDYIGYINSQSVK